MCPSSPLLTAAMASNCRGDTKPGLGGGRKQPNACDAHAIIPCRIPLVSGDTVRDLLLPDALPGRNA